MSTRWSDRSDIHFCFFVGWYMYNDSDTQRLCLTPSTPAHLSTCPPVHLLITSSYHDTLMRCHYLDVETYTLISRQYIPWCQDVDHIVVSWCVDMFVYSGWWYPFTAAFTTACHNHPIETESRYHLGGCSLVWCITCVMWWTNALRGSVRRFDLLQVCWPSDVSKTIIRF